VKVHPALWILIFLWSSCAHARTYVVNSGGTGDFPNIQAAIGAAASGDTVALTDGVFTGTGNRDVTFLGKAVVLRSLSGDSAACVLDAQGSSNGPHRAFSFLNAEGPNTVLDGLTIQGGWTGTGGGIYCGPATGPTIRNCVIAGNVANNGGGLAVSSNGYPTILDCVFANNLASGDGGGVGYEFRPDSSHMTVSRCLFRANTTYNHGGGVAVQGRNLLTDCIFIGNQASFGAGFFDCAGTSGTEFLRCTFVRNVAPGNGGAGGGGGT